MSYYKLDIVWSESGGSETIIEYNNQVEITKYEFNILAEGCRVGNKQIAIADMRGGGYTFLFMTHPNLASVLVYDSDRAYDIISDAGMIHDGEVLKQLIIKSKINDYIAKL